MDEMIKDMFDKGLASIEKTNLIFDADFRKKQQYKEELLITQEVDIISSDELIDRRN
jgi:hypothetical protein